MSLTRRSMLQALGGGGQQVDLLYGHATAESGLLTLPIPSGYYFYVFMSDIADKTNSGEVVRKARDPVGILTDKSNACNRTNTGSAASDVFVTRYDSYLTIKGTNANTSGIIVAGVDYTFIAWKETTP